MEKRTFNITACILAVVLGVLIWANVTQKQETKWDESYPMANARIEWSGAGYSGIYGRK